jgi:hypothetical protein
MKYLIMRAYKQDWCKKTTVGTLWYSTFKDIYTKARRKIIERLNSNLKIQSNFYETIKYITKLKT